MKNLFLSLVLMFAVTAVVPQETKINWITLEKAQELNNKAPRTIIMDVYTEWCGPCKMMMSNTFSNPEVVKYINENFYAVKFNGQGPESVKLKDKTYANPTFDKARGINSRNSQHELAVFLGVRAYPTLIFFDENFNLLKNEVGYKSPEAIMPVLQEIVGK